jgi:hypothetical protein
VNEIDSNKEFDEHSLMMEENKAFRQLIWEQLTIDEKIIMRTYSNNLTNNKKIHPKMMNAVLLIRERYPDFDMDCIP